MSEHVSSLVWTERGRKVRNAAAGLATLGAGLLGIAVNENVGDALGRPATCYSDTLAAGETPQQAVSRLSHGASNSAVAASELLWAYEQRTGSSTVYPGTELTVCVTPVMHNVDTGMSAINPPAAA